MENNFDYNLNHKSKEYIDSKDPFLYTINRYDHKPFHYHPHWHEFLELMFIRKGCMKTRLRNTVLTMKEKDLLVVMPGEIHSYDFEGDGILEYILLQIDSVVLKNSLFDSKEFVIIYPFFFSYMSPLSFLCSYDECKKANILPILNNIYLEIQKKELGYNLSIQSYLMRIIIWLLRRWNLNSKLTYEESNYSIYIKITPVLKYINEEYGANITTKKMAAKINISVPHFCRLFKRMTGYSFLNYLQSLRIIEAIKLLLSSEKSIKQIASTVGYKDSNFFIRVFKKQAGISPFQYRKKYSHSSLLT